MDAPGLIKRARLSSGMTQLELARKLGVSQPAVARLEAPGANPRVATLARAVAATGRELGLSLDEPLGIDESLVAASLRTSPAERLRQFESFYEFARSAAGARFGPNGPQGQTPR